MKQKGMHENCGENNTHAPSIILVVEDDEGLSRLIQKNLQRAGSQTESALNGSDAITYILNNQTKLLLLDYRLPDMSGKQVIETLAEQQRIVPFIIMTGHGDEKVAVEMMKLGARDYLVKDAEFLNVLPSVVNRVLGQLEIEERLNETETKLKESEEKYHNLIEFANVGIIAVEDDKIIQVNKRAEEIYGYSKEELIGQSTDILTPEKYSKQHKELLNKILKFGKVKKMIFEEEGLRKDGTLFPIEISFSLSQPKENTLISVMRDITERKEMEKKLLQSEKLKSLGELAGGVAHDFNNVLAAILGRVQLLRTQIVLPPGKKEKRKSVLDLKAGLEIIERAAIDGSETVRRIQEFSRRRTDDQDFTQVDINELVNNALDFTKVRWKNEAESKGIQIKIQKEFSSLPTTAGSASELREVFANLINNAVDAMPQGGQIKVKTVKEDSHIAVTLEDTGSGISRDIKDRIFDPFFTTKGVQSTGLGLSVSYGIINRHRGTIKVDSVEGEGSTFTIQLPLSKETGGQKDKEKRITSVSMKQRKARILVIEDEEDVRQLLSDILTDSGHEVETASDGNHGVEMFKKKEFDLVFTDLGMPGLSGWQVAEQIKGIDKNIPVALITGWKVRLAVSELEKSGIDFIVNKPFRLDQVLKLVKDGLEQRKVVIVTQDTRKKKSQT